MNKRLYLLSGLPLVSLAVCAGTDQSASANHKAGQAERKQPNVLFIMADQWRKQALGFMHEDPVQTPQLDAMSEWAVSFDNAVCTNPVSGPNRACIFTGKYTINNGMWANGACIDPAEPSGMGNVFKEAGYETGYIGKWHMGGIDDIVRDPERRLGFDYWYQSIAHNHFKPRFYAPEVDKKNTFFKEGWGPTQETDIAIRYINEHKDAPFCLVVSYAPPHTGGGVGFEDRYQPGKKMKKGYGYAGPAEYEALYTDDYEKNLIRPNVKPTGKFDGTQSYAHAVPGYFGALSSIDHEIGRLIECLDQQRLLENTIVVFTADHGEMMGSQGLMTKGVPFEESIGVPMLIGWKGQIAPKRETCVFNSIDIVPTLSGLAGLEAEGADGTDYSPLLLGKRFKTPEYAFTEFNFGGVGEKGRPWRAVFSEDYVYILAGPSHLRSAFVTEGYVLYDRKKDPYQMHPILRGMGYDKVINKMHKVLAKHLKANNDPFIEKMWNVSLDELPMKLYLNQENKDPKIKGEDPRFSEEYQKKNRKRKNRL